MRNGELGIMSAISDSFTRLYIEVAGGVKGTSMCNGEYRRLGGEGVTVGI